VHFAGLNVQVAVTKRRHPAESLLDVFQLQQHDPVAHALVRAAFTLM
jgi:hypothetical protein